MNETPFETDDERADSWEFDEGDEIGDGRHALVKLGGGASYEAYLAWDDKLAYQVVVKLPRPHLIDDEETLNALEREANALTRLNHPVIVRAYDAVVDGPRPHLVMEHLEGPHLARLVRRYGRLPLEQFVPLAVSLAAAVHYLGEMQLVHLDIKPRNVVVGIPPKLIDMSVARSFEDARRIDGIVGTDVYMAPEQCLPNRRHPITHKTDVWGLGVTLFHALAGRRAFERPKASDAAGEGARYPQLTSQPEPPPERDVPRALSDVVMACLRTDPAERPTAREVAEALEPALAAVPTRPRLGRLRPRTR